MIENIFLAKKIIQIGQVIEIVWQIVDFCIVNNAILKNGGHFVLCMHEKVQIHDL